jgi:hypothetical protein
MLVDLSSLANKICHHIKKLKSQKLKWSHKLQHSAVTLDDKCDVSLHSAHYTDLMVQ